MTRNTTSRTRNHPALPCRSRRRPDGRRTDAGRTIEMVALAGTVESTSAAATQPRYVGEIDTPALVVDLDVFERNLEHMAAFFRGRPAQLRPHSKSHKCP